MEGRPILTIPLGPPTAAVSYARFIDKDGKQLTVAGAAAAGISMDAVSAEEIASTVIQKKKTSAVIIGTTKLELGGTVTAGTFGTSDSSGRGVAHTAGKAVNCYFLEGGSSGEFVEVVVILQVIPTASANVADLTDNSGGTADATVEACGTAVTGVDGTGSNAASKADVDARLTSIANNFADLAADTAAIKAILLEQGLMAAP